jgi:hypothetical protein
LITIQTLLFQFQTLRIFRQLETVLHRTWTVPSTDQWLETLSLINLPTKLVPLPFFPAHSEKGHSPKNKFLKNKIIYENVLLKKDVISVRISNTI